MIKINMFSKAESIKGQGVGSAYRELINMLEKYYSDSFLIEINKKGHSDISHYHTINPEFYFNALNTDMRGVRVGYVHFLPDTLEGSIKLAYPLQKLFGKYILSFYKKMDHLIVVNPIFTDELVKKYGFVESKITFIPNFVSSETFYPQPKDIKEKFKEKMGINRDSFVVLGVGQIQKRKGIDDFIKLAHRNPDIQFIWAGGFSFGRITDGYGDYQQIYDNPPDNLNFTGIVERSQMINYYNLADVFLLPSYNELFPMSILEAFSCGTLVLLRDLELYRSVIDGYYSASPDMEHMSSKLQEFKAAPQLLNVYKSLSKKAADYYSEENVAKKWHEFYYDIAKKMK